MRLLYYLWLRAINLYLRVRVWLTERERDRHRRRYLRAIARQDQQHAEMGQLLASFQKRYDQGKLPADIEAKFRANGTLVGDRICSIDEAFEIGRRERGL